MIEARHIQHKATVDTKIGKLRNIVSICGCQIVKKFTAAQARNGFVTQAALGNKLEKLESFEVPEIFRKVLKLF